VQEAVRQARVDLATVLKAELLKLLDGYLLDGAGEGGDREVAGTQRVEDRAAKELRGSGWVSSSW
jgi:hypothetical protein